MKGKGKRERQICFKYPLRAPDIELGTFSSILREGPRRYLHFSLQGGKLRLERDEIPAQSYQMCLL